jgi:hypothetical protein
MFLLAAALLISRDPGRLWQPELWAEDGTWIKQAYDMGYQSLLLPHTGYLQTISRLGGLAAVHITMVYAPAMFAGLAFIIQLAPVAFLLSARGAAGLPSLAARLLIIFYYIGEPNSYEISVNLTNAMWHLALIAFMVLVFPKPQSKAGTGFDILALSLSGLSGPFAIVNAILALWEAWRKPDLMTRVYAAVTCGCAAIQIGYLIFVPRFLPALVNGATFMALVHILNNQVFASGIIGASLTTSLIHSMWWRGEFPSLVLFLASLFLVGLGFWLSNAQGRKFLLFAAALLAASLYSPVISADHHQWLHLENPLIGTRYFVIPILGWFIALLSIAAAAPVSWLKFLGRFLILACAIGVVSDWKMIPFYATGYRSTMMQFQASPSGTVMKFVENPPGWYFRLVKK